MPARPAIGVESSESVTLVTGSSAPARVAATPGATPPAGRPADSKIPPRRFVIDRSVQPGLVDFAGQMPQRGSLWVGKLKGNGGRAVLVHIPPNPDNGAQFQLVYHFHGTYSEHIARKRPGVAKKKWVGWNRLQQTIDAAAELQQRSRLNIGLIYPVSAGKRPEPTHKGWFNKAYDRMWMSHAPPDYTDDFDTLHAEVLEILNREFEVHPSKLTEPVIVEGHSAGGMALLNIATQGTNHVREYIFQDAGFQGWADGCFAAVNAQKSDALVTLVITDNGIADPFGKRDPWCTKLERAGERWQVHRRGCQGRAEASPTGVDQTCRELEAEAGEWAEYETWCAGMKNDMRDVPNLYVHRTKVYHGEQPRHFTGGLELPPQRYRLPSTR